ncbi:MAG: tetratricopeptide repeat protein, partial [Candidatus Hodarchaeales archaeon]
SADSIDNQLKIDTQNELAICNRVLNEFEEAMSYSFDALKLATQMNYFLGQAEALHNLGVLSQMAGAFDDALDYLRRSIAIKEKIPHSQKLIARSLLHVGIISRRENKLDKAEGNLHTAFRLFRLHSDLESQLGSLSVMIQLSNCKLLKEIPREALKLYEDAITVAEELENEFFVQKINRMSALSYWMLDSPNTNKVFSISLIQAEQFGRIGDLATTKFWMGIYYWSQKESELAWLSLNESYNHFKSANNTRSERLIVFYIVVLSSEIKPELTEKYCKILEDLWKEVKLSKEQNIETLLQIELSRVLNDQVKAKKKGYSFGIIRKYETVLRHARRQQQVDMAFLIYTYLFNLLIPDNNEKQSFTLLKQATRDFKSHATLRQFFQIAKSLIELYFRLDFTKALEQLKKSKKYFQNKGLDNLNQKLDNLTKNCFQNLQLMLEITQPKEKDRSKIKELKEKALEYQAEIKEEILIYLEEFKFKIIFYKQILPSI